LIKNCDDHENENVEYFLCIGRHKWDMSFFHFDGDPIYDVDDDFRVNNVELFPLEHTSINLMIHIFGNMKMTCSHICFNHLGMIHYNIHMMTSMHILGGMIHILFKDLDLCCEGRFSSILMLKFW
jgi:hypothetical protein